MWTTLVLVFALICQSQSLESPPFSETTTPGDLKAEMIQYGNELIPGPVEPFCDPGDRPINKFSWEDYSVVGAMLAITCGIALFLSCYSKKSTSSDDFLLGDSSMGTAPVAMSIGTSFITAIELLGNPSEMYNYGSQFWMICASFILVVPIASKLYLPVYMKLRLTSCFQYLELRFSKSVRMLASSLYILQMLFYTTVAVYAPALALSNVTGLHTYITVSVVYVVCTFYATLGGMKTVIITDSFQTAVLIGSLILVLIFGESMVGGLEFIWSHNNKTERFEFFNMDPNPTVRHTFWSVVVGGTFYWTTMFCSNQASIQKYLSVKKISQVRRALWISSVGLIIVYSVNFYMGMVLTAHYRGCDPLRSDVISASDQLLPLFVMDTMGHMKGLPGFFAAGIFAASLGTVAAALTSVSAATCQDFIIGMFNVKLPDKKGATVAKWITVLSGVLSFSLIFIVERLGSVLQLALSFNGMVGGVTLGLFSLGMFFPWANAKGALTGALVSLALVMWIGGGAQVAMISGNISLEAKETSITECPCYNETQVFPEPDYHPEAMALYRISYMWYSAIGCLTTIIIGVIVSLCTKPTDPCSVALELQSPPFIWLYESLPITWKARLNLPKPGDKGRRRSTIIRTLPKRISNAKDEKDAKEGDNINGNVFYSIWIGSGTYTSSDGEVNQAIDVSNEEIGGPHQVITNHL